MPRSDAPRLWALVLAAGGSRRLGSPKQLLPVDGVPLVRRSAIAAARVCGDRVVVVTGAGAASVRGALDGLRVHVVHNPRWRAGLATTLRHGIAFLEDASDGVMVVACDQARIRAADLISLASAWRQRPERPAAASYDDTVGVPAILPAALYGRIATLRGDTGAGGLLRAAPALTAVSMPEAAFDVDHRRDLARLGNGAMAAEKAGRNGPPRRLAAGATAVLGAGRG